MDEKGPKNVTRLLAAANEGDSASLERLIDLIYDEVHEIAIKERANERRNDAPSATTLVDEALLRLFWTGDHSSIENRQILFSACARAMRRILVDHARHRNAIKHGGRHTRSQLDDMLAVFDENLLDLLALDEALCALANEDDPRMLKFIELTYFVGYTPREIAEMHDLTDERVRQILRAAKDWLRAFLSRE